MKLKPVYIVLVLFLLSVIQGCSAIPLTPSQTVEQFWGAVLASDIETAGRFVTAESRTELSSLQEKWQGATVKFGEVRISSDQANVDTTLDVTQGEQTATTRFSTFLQREKDQWQAEISAIHHCRGEGQSPFLFIGVAEQA